MQNNDNTRKLYDALTADNYKLGDFETFASDISKSGNLRKLYDAMVADNYKLGDFETFSSQLGNAPQDNVTQQPKVQPVVDAYGMPMQPEVSTIEDAPKVEEKPQENLKSDLFKPQSTETPSLLNVGAKPKDYFAEAGAKAMDDIRQERQAREYQEIMKPYTSSFGRKKEHEFINTAEGYNQATRIFGGEEANRRREELNEQARPWMEAQKTWTPSSARRFREQTMEQTWYDPYAVVPEEYKALATQKWGKEGSEDAYFSAWMNLSPEEREAFVKREHIKSFFNEETANRMQGIRERATTYAQNALSEPVVSVDPRHSASAMAARTVSNIGVQTTKALDKAEEIKQAYKNHQLDENFFVGAYKGMKDGLSDIDNWTGLYMVGEMNNLYNIADKMERGDALTQTEEDFLDAQAYKLAVEAALADDLGWGYGSGNVTGASIPFMLQMLASPMSGASGKAIDKGFAAVGRRAIDKFGKGILKKLLTKAPVKKVVKGLVGTVGKGIGQTILFGSDRVAAGTMERHLGNEMVAERANEEFNAGVQAKAGEDLGTALFKAGVSTSMENISEFAGSAFIDDFTKMAGKKIAKEFTDAISGSVGSRLMRAATNTRAGKALKNLANAKIFTHGANLVKSIERGTQWDGLLNEYLEEVLNNASNVMIGDMTMEDFTSLEKNAETVLGLAWTSGFFAVNNAASRIKNYVKGNNALKHTERAARQVFAGNIGQWEAYTQALSQADGYEEAEKLYSNFMKELAQSQDKELAKAQMSEATAYMANYVKMMGMNAATEEADKEEQKTPAQEDSETALGEGIAAAGTEQELDIVEEMEESALQLSERLQGMDPAQWMLQFGETADMQLEAIRGSELDEQTKAMAETYLASAQRYEGVLLANQEEIDAKVEEAARDFDANVNQELGSVIEVLTPKTKDTEGKRAYVVQGNPEEAGIITLRYEDGTTEQTTRARIAEIVSNENAEAIRSAVIEGVRRSAVAEVAQRMNEHVLNAAETAMFAGHNVIVDGQPGVVADMNQDGTLKIQMQDGKTISAAPQQVMDAEAYNTIMERKARAREGVNFSVPVREEAEAPVSEVAAPVEELTEAQMLLQEYMDESVPLEDRMAIVGNNVAQAKQTAMEAQAEVDAMNESKPKATDYTSIVEFKQAQEQWKAQMQEKQQLLDLARQQEATWNEVQSGMNQPVVAEEASEQTSTKAVNDYMVSDEVDENGRAFVYSPNGSIEFGVIGADTGLTPAPILLSEGMITNPSTNDGYGLVHIEARHGDQIRAAGYKGVIEFVNEVAKNYEVIREGRDRNGHQTYMLQLTDKHNNTLMVELSGDGTYWNINTAGIFKTSYGRNRKEVYHRHTTAKQSTETVGVSQGIEQSGTQMPSSMNTPTSSASKDTQSVSTEQTDKKEISVKSTESNVEVTKSEAKSHNSKHDIKALAKEIGVSAKRIQRVVDFASQMGVKLNFASVTRTQGNKGALTNADNMASKREITLSKYQLAKGMAIEWVMGHELTHQIKADGNAANWEAYKQAIINALGQDTFDKRVKVQSKVYREAGAYKDMSANAFHESMVEEVCADAAGDMLLNPDNMNKVMGVPQTLASRIWSALKDMVTFGTPTRIKQAADAWQQLAEGKELTGEADGREAEQDVKHSIPTQEPIGRSLAADEAEILITDMKENADIAPELEFSIENWLSEFGKDGLVTTPIGKVKMGENQIAKLLNKNREKRFGLIRPTLQTPDVIIEKHAPAEGAERESKFLFIKTFVKPDGSRFIHFESVTVLKDGMDVSISSHEIGDKALRKEMQNGSILHLNSKLSSGSDKYLTKTPTERPDLVPAPDNRFNISPSLGGGVSPISHADDAAPAISLQSRNDDELSAGKGTQSVPTIQTDKEEISEKSAESNVEVTNEGRSFSITPEVRAEMDAIVAEAKANGKYLKAPNGEDTKLNPEQWALVRTQNFKKWFGDWENNPENASKIIDENGEPMVMYHGGTFGIKDFVPNGAMHFGSKVAAMERVLDTEWGKDNYSIKNSADGYSWEYADPDDADYDRSSGRTFASYEDALEDAVGSIDGVRIGQYYINAKNPMRVEDKDNTWEGAISIARETGADAIVYENQFEDIGSDSYIAFSPTQIKSATDNVGTFDAENADIRYSMPGYNIVSHIYGHPFTGAWQKFLQRAPKGVLKPGYGIIDESRLPEFADWYRMLVPEAEEYKEFVSWFLKDATATEKKHIQSVMDRVDKIVDDYRRLAEGDNSVLSLENNARFSITPDILAANERFNEELDTLTQENADRMIFDLGTPSVYLKSAGVHDKPMKLYGSKIIKKQKKHGFRLEELRNLPIAIADPIAVFDNHDEEGNRSILTELNTDAGNILVAISLGKGADIDFNIISSAFGKDTNKIVNWIKKGFGKYYNKEKALEYLHLAAPIAAASDNQELSDATKIVQDFQNPPLPVDESSQNVENAKSGEQKYSLPARPATPKRNEGEGIMEYAQRVANATEAQKAWDVANKTAMDIDRQIKNSEEYRDILAQKEPQTIEEAASLALAGGKLLWNDHVDGTKVSKGAKSMMGWGEGERQKFFAMFASKENGGVSVEQMGEAVMDICSQYNIPVDENDAMAGTNAVLEVLQSAQRPSDITGYIEHNRIEQVRRMIEEEQELLASERNRAYMDMYGMTYDDFVEIASTIDAEDEQERSDDKNAIAWLYGQSQRQQERITNAQAELKQLKKKGVPKNQYDAAYRALEQMKAKVKRTQEKLDEATKELRTAKGQATRLKKANMRYKAKKGQWKQVFQKLREAINGKNIRSIDKNTLNEIMRAVGSADLSGIARLFGEAGMVEDIILGVNMRATQDRIDKLLATKTTALNDKGIATGKSVDASVQAILANVRKTLEGILHHDIENQIHDLRSQNWHISHNAKGNLSQEQQEQVDANKAKIEELKAELGRELATNTASTEQAVNEQIEKLTEQIDKGLRTEEESAELMTTLALKRQMVAIHTSYQDTATVEALLRRKLSEVRTNWVALHDGNIPKDKRAEYRQKRKALQEQIAGLEAQVREGRQATLDAMQSFADSLEETITTGRANLKGKMQEQLQRRKEFVAKAIHDVNASGKQMQSVNEADKQENDKLPWYKRMFSPALRTFDYILQKIATRTYGKDSWLYRQFMLGENGVMAAHDEYLRGMQTAARTLEDKAKEIFGKSYQDVMAESNRKKDIGIEILRDAEDYEPSYIPLKLTKGQATYIYMLWRMRDGYSKLATQGFTEEIMQRIEEYIGPDYIQWADWIQTEYLPMMREKYNARYREIYDTNMAAIDNYVPIRIHGQAIRKEVDLTDATASMPGMQKKNGALIQRTVNVNPIDISNNIFELIGQHIDEMEEFYAYAPVRRDLQYILSSPAFRNILNANEPGTFQSLLEAARIATKTNQQPESAALKAFNDFMNKTQKGLVSGNIAYRNMTAIKQVLSAPAFIGYSQSPEYLGMLAKNMFGGYIRNLPTMMFPLIPGIGHWAQKMTVEETAKGMPYIDKFLGETFRWCMREFPDFRERVTRGSAGDIRLEEKGFSELLDKYTEIGMSANVFIDAVTVSIGLKSIYDYEMEKAKKRIQKMAKEMQMDEQWAEEEMRKASNAAKIQATLFANQTQQSSNPALLSPMQVSKNFMERSLTLYKNSSLGLMRAGIGGMRNLLRYMKGKKARHRMTEEYTRMFMQEGFAENEAKKRAISYVKSEARKGAFVALLEGFAMNLIWNLGSKGLLGFMAGGGDDDDKERTTGEMVWDGTKFVINNTFGSAIPFVDDALEGRLPAIGLTTSEAEKAWKDIKKQLDENGISLAFALTGMRYAAKFGGVDMQVWANTMDGYYRLFSETGNDDENILALMLILNSPHSNRIAVARELYKGKSEEEFQRAIELAGRYSQPVWTFGREMTDKVESDMAKWYLSDNATDEEKQRMHYIEDMEERIDNLETVEDALEMFDEVSDTELRKKISSKIDQISKPEETFAEKVGRMKENALAEDDTDMVGYTYMMMSDSQDLLEEKRMRAEIDMLRPIVEQQKELFEEYGSQSGIYTRFMAEHGAEIRRYNTLKAYSRAIQMRKRKMDEEGANVQALYEEIKELYNDARNV